MTWYREVVADLRDSWRPDLSWEEVIGLRARLQGTVGRLAAIRRERRSRAGFTCSHCGGHLVFVITVRAVLFATKRFGLETAERLEVLDREWAKYREAHNLDSCGEPAKARVPAAGHGHSKRQQRGARPAHPGSIVGPAEE